MPIANSNSPRGFQIYRCANKNGPTIVPRTVNGARVKDIMIGDYVTIQVDGSVLRTTSNAATGLHGVVVGIQLNPKSQSSQGPESQDYIPAADAGAVLVCEDSVTEFVVQIATFTAATDVLENAELVDADGDQTLRQSRQSITAGNAQFRVIELADMPANNAAGAFALVVVRNLLAPM